MRVCESCAAGRHFCEGGGCECFCDAPDAYWSPEDGPCECCEYEPARPIETVELPGISR